MTACLYDGDESDKLNSDPSEQKPQSPRKFRRLRVKEYVTNLFILIISAFYQ